MPDFFDEQDYKRRLIEGGLDPDSAAVTARRTAEARKESGADGSTPRPISSALAALTIEPQQDDPPPPKTAATSSRMDFWAAQQAAEGAALVEALKVPQERRTAIDGIAEKLEVLAEAQRQKAKADKPKTATQALAAKAHEAQQAAVLKKTKEQIKELQLSLFDLAPWPNDMRAIPNDLARAALFTTRNKRTPRAAYERHPIFHVNNGVEITYTGFELRADDDELIWQQVLEYAKRTPIGTPVSFTFYDLCGDVGWHRNGRYYDRAESCLTRLQASALQFSSVRLGRLESVSLIGRFRVLDRGKKNSRCQVEIDDEVVLLFAGDHYSRFIWEQYRVLSPTARRMFDYFVSHKEPYPLKLETFRLMCGSDSARPKKWREQAALACSELTESGLIELAEVVGDSIRCKR